MDVVNKVWPSLLAMAALIGCSAFFSASEAALFSLRPRDRQGLRTGNRSQRAAASLLSEPERLLTAVLFWNLLINVTYFATASMTALQLERESTAGETGAVGFTFATLLIIILFSEMVPKSLGVVSARSLTRFVGLPLSASVRLLDPLMPMLQTTNLLSRRLIWPRFEAEEYLEVADLERAIKLSASDDEWLEQEHTVLQNIVTLSDIRVDEAMRPRSQCRIFTPPVDRQDLDGEVPASGYLLVTDTETDVVAGAINMGELSDVPAQHLERLTVTVVYVPWFQTVAEALQQMLTRERQVAAVVNEVGDTVGILTFNDILDTIFRLDPTRSARLLNQQSIGEVDNDTWNVTGLTSLRRLARHFDVQLPESNSVTLAGVAQETLERLPVAGDQFDWGPFRVRVLEASESGIMIMQLTLTTPGNLP